ncbi:hypothetical protein ACLMJK_001400 [Lecanora helva]
MADTASKGSETVTWTGHKQDDSPPDLRFLHFNDVYHIEPGSAEPVGGIPRFQTVANSYRSDPKYATQPRLITLFSGDAFNPSLESSITKGRHMVPILNGIGTDAACVGNHDLDFGISQFRHLSKQCNFPWLLANVLDPALGVNVSLAGCPKTAILESSNEIKVGLIGLAEREWLDTINSLPPDLIYKSASQTANELVPDLRAQGAEIVIALTHAREPSDLKLATKTSHGLLDIILGGHDHFYSHHIVNDTNILRSGSDFKQLSYIEAWRRPRGQPGWDFNIIRRDITRSIKEDQITVELVDRLTSSLKNKLEKPIGYSAVPLDARFTTVRTKESNLGNFVCDLMRHYYDTDCALMASGTIRGDQIYPPGVLRLKDILDCFPFEDPVIVIRLSGKAILQALENSICLVPALEGRYPQVSNIKFTYNPKLSPGSRVNWARIHGEPLNIEKLYTMATRGYMGRGKDGYESLLVKSEGGQCEEIISEENGILISMIMRQYFMSLKVLGKWTRWSPSLHRHWDGVNSRLHDGGRVRAPSVAINGSHHQRLAGSKNGNGATKTDVDGRLIDSDTEDEKVLENEGSVIFPPLSPGSIKLRDERKEHVARKFTRKWMSRVGIQRKNVRMATNIQPDDSLPPWTHGIAPQLEGRILVDDNDN